MKQGLKKNCFRLIGWAVVLLPTFFPCMISAQVPTIAADDSLTLAIDSIFAVTQPDTAMIAPTKRDKIIFAAEKSPFKPNPKIAWRVAAVFPGFGQFYNRQYWKLPIVYGGLMGCTYAVSWNNRTYQDYHSAYFSIINDLKADPNAEHPDTWNENWLVFVPGGRDPATYLRNSQFHSNLKRGKDYFRRYRDMSIIFTIAFWGICVADAYVDAQMFDFDVSTDLSFHITPQYSPSTFFHSRCYGINICMNF